MTTRVMRTLLAGGLSTALASCVTPSPGTPQPLSAPSRAANAPAAPPAARAPSIIVPGTESPHFFAPYEYRPKDPHARFCLLGTMRCADLGAPATACLLSGKRCGMEGGKLERIEETPPIPSP